MGANYSVPRKYRIMEKNYTEGINKRKNFNLDQIYVTLLMKLTYYQTKYKLSKLPQIHEAVAYSNTIKKPNILLPRTIDFISGINITNPNDQSCVIKIIWDGRCCGLEETVLETFQVNENSSYNYCFSNLYMYMAQHGSWKATVSADDVSLEFRCGIVSSKGKQRITNIYKNLNGRKFDFVAGTVMELPRNRY